MRARPAPSRLAIASLLTGVLLAVAAPGQAAPTRAVDVIEVSGRIDPIAADFIDEFLTAHLELLQIWRTERRIGRAGKNQIGDFQIADWAVVWSRLWVDLFRNPE